MSRETKLTAKLPHDHPTIESPCGRCGERRKKTQEGSYKGMLCADCAASKKHEEEEGGR